MLHEFDVIERSFLSGSRTEIKRLFVSLTLGGTRSGLRASLLSALGWAGTVPVGLKLCASEANGGWQEIQMCPVVVCSALTSCEPVTRIMGNPGLRLCITFASRPPSISGMFKSTSRDRTVRQEEVVQGRAWAVRHLGLVGVLGQQRVHHLGERGLGVHHKHKLAGSPEVTARAGALSQGR